MTTVLNTFRLVVVVCVSQVLFAQENEIPDLVNVENDELIFAHILFRHGDRTVTGGYRYDPWKRAEFWPEGFGQLTNVGKQQQYELGSYLRKRYYKLLPENGTYSPNNIYIQSSDVDRCIMSAAYTLAGMFPPTGQEIWNNSLMWQAIPIHTIPKRLDHILAAKRSCPLYKTAYDVYKQSDEVQSLLQNNQALIKYVEKSSGHKIKSVCDLKSVYNTLWIQQLKKFELPKWSKTVFVPGGDMEKLAHSCFGMDVNTTLLARLKAGFLIRDIFERFNMKKDSMLFPDRSLWIYSAHDTTLARLLNALNVFDNRQPDYSSCIFFELHRANGNYHVELFYKQDRGDDKVPLEPLQIPKCGQKCPLDEFYEIYKNIIPTDDFDTECRPPSII